MFCLCYPSFVPRFLIRSYTLILCFSVVFLSITFYILFYWTIYSLPTSKIIISGIPLHAHFEDIEPLLKRYGKVEYCDAVSSKDPHTQTVHITYETPEQALRYRPQSHNPHIQPPLPNTHIATTEFFDSFY